MGVNEYVTDQIDDVEILRVDPKSEEEQVERLKEFKADRDQEELQARLGKLRETAEGDGNLLYPIRDALAAKATIGEVCGVMREVFGEYHGGVRARRCADRCGRRAVRAGRALAQSTPHVVATANGASARSSANEGRSSSARRAWSAPLHASPRPVIRRPAGTASCR